MVDSAKQQKMDAENLKKMKEKVKASGNEKVLIDRDLKIATAKLFAGSEQGRAVFKGLTDKYCGATIADPEKTFAHACEAQGKVNLLREFSAWINNFNNGNL